MLVQSKGTLTWPKAVLDGRKGTHRRGGVDHTGKVTRSHRLPLYEQERGPIFEPMNMLRAHHTFCSSTVFGADSRVVLAPLPALYLAL